MVRRVFFSFHYEKDVWRASQVRNCWVTKPDRDAVGFWDAAEWESLKRQGIVAVKRWINQQIHGTSVTVVLVGSETSRREWVRYEIEHSIEKENGLLFIHIHNLKDRDGEAGASGDLDFGFINGTPITDIYPVYDWVDDDGYENIGDWIEISYQISRRPLLKPPLPRSARPSGCIRR